jgi:hypothetical protein
MVLVVGGVLAGCGVGRTPTPGFIPMGVEIQTEDPAGGIDVVPPKPACSEADFGAGGVGACGGLGILRPAHRSRSQG